MPEKDKPKSATMRVQSSNSKTKSASGSKSPVPQKVKAGAKKKDSKTLEDSVETPQPEVEKEDGGLPANVFPIFLSSQTQKILGCVCDEDVTDENPFKLLTKDAIKTDIFNRAAVSDFQPFKKIVEDYDGDEILVVYDADFKYGQNFYWAQTEEAKATLLKGPEAEGAAEGEEAEGEYAEDKVYRYIPPEAKDWQSLGSEREIEEESLVANRKLIRTTVKRVRREFGAPITFTDRNVGDAKDGYQECAPYEDKSFDLKRMELDKALQAIPLFSENSSQTEWRYPRNNCTQYQPREFTEEEAKEHLESDALKEFIQNAVPKFELALQQNEIMNIFFDDWTALSEEDSSFGSKADNHLKEYQSFTDLQFSKEKAVTAVQWHPSLRGVIAVAVAERQGFYERIDNAARVIMSPSLILIWSFSDPIHPQLLLEAPDDIYSFNFCPTDPNIVVGGCVNGQVVLWDISTYLDKLRNARSGNKNRQANVLPGFEDDSSLETPIARYCAVSSIENSHRAPVTDVQWVPAHFELSRMGVPQENKQDGCVQIMTCGIDYSVMIWDIRPPKTAAPKKKDTLSNPMNVPNTFKHLDLVWKPHMKVILHKSEPGGDHSPTKFSIQERHGDKADGGEDDDLEQKSKDSIQGGFSYGNAKPSSGTKRTLKSIKTHFFVGTEDGEVVYCDWMPQKDQDTGKVQTPKPDFYHTLHDGPVNTLERSPFFKDVLLVVGGFTFTLWKEGLTSGPILSSCASNHKYTAGSWSPSRPAVFYLSRADGSVDVWDLLDRTHEPSMSQSVSPSAITTCKPHIVTAKQHLLAVGDNVGTLHVLEIPWSLRQPTVNELHGLNLLMTITGMSNYVEREVKRRSFVMARWDFREKEKMEMEQEAKRKAGIAPAVQLTDEEMEQRQRMEYKTFCDEEQSFLRELGLLQEDLPSLD